MESQTVDSKLYSRWHWVFQLAPPTLILCTLFSTRNGSALVFLAGFFIIPVLISIVSIVLKLLAFSARKYFLLRPVLTIIFFGTVMGISAWSYEIALGQATEAAERLQQQCRSEVVCPTEPSGWNSDGRRISRRDLGTWYQYIASYVYDPNSFQIRVNRGPDIGHVITGGVDTPFSVERYLEN